MTTMITHDSSPRLGGPNLQLIAAEVVGVTATVLGLIADCRDHLAGRDVPGLAFGWAVDTLRDAFASLEDVWVHRRDPTKIRREEPSDPQNFDLYSRTALVEALAGQELAMYLP